MSNQYVFKGFTKKARRKRYLKFLDELKKRKIKIKEASINEGEERHKVGDFWRGATFYGKGGILKYTIFNDDKSIPKDMIKKYAGCVESWFKLIISVVLIVILLTLVSGIYVSYRWSTADEVYGVVEDIREHCYLARGLFSTPNEVCKTDKMQVDGIWYINKGNNIFHKEQHVELKCLMGYGCK